MVRIFAVALTIAACGGSPGGTGGGDDAPPIDAPGTVPGDPGVFDPAITKVVVEIDYEMGQDPYTGPIIGFGDTFDPTVTNVDRLFAGNKTLTIPTTTAAMQQVGTIADEELTVTDILALAELHRDEQSTTDTKTYWVIFVSGHFADASGVRNTVLGVAIGDHIAMFKDVIRSTDVVGFPNVVRYVEQSTLIHELAHSIGLVDNGVPMVADHKDEPHGAHCTNQNCVMFWQNEGASDAAQFAQRQLLSGSTVLFDAACLADVDALTGGP